MRLRRGMERAILFVVSFSAICFVTFSVYSDHKVYRQRTLFYQLQILRMGVNIYQLMHYENPKTLKDLLEMTYSFPGDRTERRYVEGITTDGEKNLIDPFGNLYQYDKLTGWVRSTTAGYEFW